MKKYLITGCAGFIGSNFVYYMLKKHVDIEKYLAEEELDLTTTRDAESAYSNAENIVDLEEERP